MRPFTLIAILKENIQPGCRRTAVIQLQVWLVALTVWSWPMVVAGQTTSPRKEGESSRVFIGSSPVSDWWIVNFQYVILGAALLLLVVTAVMIYCCLKKRESKQKAVEWNKTQHMCLWPAVAPCPKPMPVQPVNKDIWTSAGGQLAPVEPSLAGSVKGKQCGLLHRRGSNNSLTIDLNAKPLGVPCPTLKECSTQEFLASASNRIPRKELRALISDPHRIYAEFWSIPMNHPDRIVVTGSGTKNRYRSIIPNEHSRVILPELPGDALSTYINANYMRGYRNEQRAFIATQGPMAHTMQDFWSMVWNERVPIVVMITRLEEKNKTKCEDYIPEYIARFGAIEVQVDSVENRDAYQVRRITLRCNGEVRRLRHFWFHAWPDHRTPDVMPLLHLVQEVEEVRQMDRNGPTVVHCSAGIGRTGCFLAISVGWMQLLYDSRLDVLGIVCQLRQDRGGMVQTNEQYEFVYRALAEVERTMPPEETTITAL